MKKKRLFKGILCSAVLAGCLMIAKPLTGHAEEMPETNTSKGVTMETENNTDYLYLNGNSVVIKEADASTEDNPLINLYIDANRNGIVDADETMVSVDDVRDFQPCRIYGAKAEKLTAPFRITVESGTVKAIYGVYGSEAAIQSSNEAAVTIDIKRRYGFLHSRNLRRGGFLRIRYCCAICTERRYNRGNSAYSGSRCHSTGRKRRCCRCRYVRWNDS